MIKTLIYSNTGLSSWQIGINTEVIDRLNHEKRELRIVNCNSILNNCFFNKTHHPIGCALCQSRQKILYKRINVNSSNQINLKPIKRKVNVPHFDNLQKVIDYEFQGYNLGRGVASSIISYLREYNINSAEHEDLIGIEITKSINVLLNFKEIIASFKPQEIYLFNGRFAEVWPVILLAKEQDIDYYCIESGSPNKYELFKNSLPHSIVSRSETITKLWNEADNQDRKNIASSWFENRRYRKNTEELQFTLEQKTGLLPDSFDKSKKNIVIFNSSEDELKAIQEWDSGLYHSQTDAIENIAEYFHNERDTHLYIRVHPNLSKLNNSQIKALKEIHQSNVTVIAPEDPTDTYTLMDVADIVISFGSSTGIEATYWGIPSVLFGNSFYMNLNAIYLPRSYQELYKVLNSQLIPKPSDNALPYGYYMRQYGRETEIFNFIGLSKSLYKNKKIPILSFQSLIKMAQYSLGISKWIKATKALKKNNFKSLFKFH